MLTFEQLVEGFRDLGVEEGETLLVHSSYKSLGEVDGGPQTVVRALEAALGPEGTLIMPTFNFDFNKGVPWDVRKTRVEDGCLDRDRSDGSTCQAGVPSVLFVCGSGQACRDAGEPAIQE